MLSINVSQFATGYYLIFQCVTNNLVSSELMLLGGQGVAAKSIDGPTSMADVDCSCGEAAMEMIIVSYINKTA